MNGPKDKGGTYEYTRDHIEVTTDTGQKITAHGEGADRLAEHIGADKGHGKGDFHISEKDWDDAGRGSFR